MILPGRFELAGTLARLQVRVGQAEAQSLLWIENETSFADAGPPDAGPSDASHSDAGAIDATLAIDAGP